MIGGVKPRAFEHDPDRREDLPQGLFTAFRAAGERRVVKVLMALEAHTAILTLIRIGRHPTPQHTVG